MTAADIITGLLVINLAASAAIIAVLAFRGMVRRLAGAQVAYLSWLAVPAAVAVCLLPARIVTIEAPAPSAIVSASTPSTAAPTSPPVYPPLTQAPRIEPAPAPVESVLPAPSAPATAPSVDIDWMLVLALVWAAVAIGALVFLLVRERLAVRALGPLARVSSKLFRASESTVGPAVVGVFAPRIVLPANFEAAFDETERKVVIAHEEAHLNGRHTTVKAIVEIAVCLSWFNPLAYLAARSIAMDQELACDEAVVRRYPERRKAYAGVLLKNQAGPRAPLGCYWPARSARGLKTRIAQIANPPPGRKRRIAGGAILMLTAAIAAGAAWASKPPQTRIVATVAHQSDPAPKTAALQTPLPGPTPQPVRLDEPQQSPTPQTPEPPRKPEGQGLPDNFEAVTPFILKGKVEKIDFRDRSYVLFIRAAYTASPPPDYMNTFWGIQPNTALWEMAPTNYFGDTQARDAIIKDLTNREVRVTGVSSTPRVCEPACKMTITSLQMVKPTALPALSQQSPLSFADLITRYDVLKAAYVRGTVQKLEFSDRMFDAYVQSPAVNGVPGAVYQVRSEYRFPRADIEQRLLNRPIVAAGWLSKMQGDTVCETSCGIYATDIALPDGTRLTPAGESLISQPRKDFRNEPGTPPTIMPGHFDYIDGMNRFDATAQITIEGKIVQVDDQGLWVEAQRFEPASAPGAKPGTTWRVVTPYFLKDPYTIGKTITVRGFLPQNKSCQPNCSMSGGSTWIR